MYTSPTTHENCLFLTVEALILYSIVSGYCYVEYLAQASEDKVTDSARLLKIIYLWEKENFLT